MALLIWNHGTTRAEARRIMERRLKEEGVLEAVKWKDDTFKATVGWGLVLDLQGEIRDDAIVLEKSGGGIGQIVLQKAEAAFSQMFPGGKQPIPSA